MEGYLSKWTNYLSGWKPRYFVLNQGVLSYYLSSEEVGAGCRGSVRVVHCQTVSHPFDHCRLDIVLPSKQYLYLRASTASERQQWLVALVNSKIEGEGRGGEVGTPGRREGDAKLLKERRKELHLTRQLLLRQIAALKKEIDSVALEKEGDIQKVRSLGLLASATCDKFINSLDDCITIHDRVSLQSAAFSELEPIISLPSPSGSPSRPHFPPLLPAPSRPRPALSDTPTEVQNRVRPAYLYPLHDLTSSSLDTHAPTHTNSEKSLTPASPKDDTIRESLPPSPLISHPPHSETILSPLAVLVTTILSPSVGGQILIEPFIATSKLIPDIVISTFGTIFTPIKSDMLQNVAKIMSKHTQYEREHSTVQALLLAEMEKGEHVVDMSARTGVLWLNRTLHFIQAFFSGLGEDNLETSAALNRAYAVALMPHHNFIMRGLFSLLMHQVPTRADIVLTLCKGDPDREATNIHQMKLIAGELSRITHQIHEFYAMHGLD